MSQRVRILFREKLLLIFFILSVVPLIAVAYLVSSNVQNSYKEILTKSFESNVDFREKLLTNYLESNKSWIKSIAVQDVFLGEMEKYAVKETYSQNRMFASLVSLKRENQFINKVYIVDKDGIIVASTTSDDEGKNVSEINETLKNNPRVPYYHKLHTNTQGTRIITLTTPFIRRNNGEIIGSLVTEYNASVIKSLRDGSIYNSQSINEDLKAKLADTYVIDEDNYLLTSISGTNIEKTPNVKPIEACQQGATLETGQWINKDNKEVFGSYLCNKIDHMSFIFIVEEETSKAFAVSNNIRNTIFIITASIGLLLVISIFKIAESVTKPVKQLARGAQEFGKGNFNYSFQVTTGDELEELANSFSDMSKKVNAYVSDLKNQEEQVSKFNDVLKIEKEKISAERNKLEVIIAGISDAVIALNMDREVVICNKAGQELIELAESEIIGHKIGELIALEDENGPLSENTYSPIRTDDFEGVIYHNDNLTFRSAARKSARVKLITGKIKEGVNANLGCILTFHDMHSEAELEEMKMDFVSMAAHELRTPITSIRGYSNLLGDEIEELADPRTPEWKMLISRISISAEQLLALVENLLNVTKIEKGILTIAQKNENWSQCIMDVANEFKERASSKQITLNLKEPDPNLIAYVDKLRINEVITNLISNAINYTQNGGTITVEAHVSADGDWIETSVSDNGKGIPKSAQTHLFEKFFRVTGPLEQGSKGNGLGLYISKSIVEMHGGKIWVESDEGKGAKFSYTVQRVKTVS